MSRRNLILLTATVAVIVIAAILLLRRPPPPAPPSLAATAPVAVAPVPAAPETPAPAPSPETVTPPTPPEVEAHVYEPVAPRAGIPPEQVVRVRADQVLAIVNGVSITLKDLSPAGAGVGAEESMTKEEYQARLNRAIEAELTFQEARKQGVELTAEQLQNLQQLGDRHAADIQQYRDQGMMWTSVTPEQIDFQAKQAAAIMLQRTLLAQAGAPSLYPMQVDIDKYYEQNVAQYGELPTEPAEQDAAWTKINFEILKKLSPQFQEQYLQWLKQYMNQLRASANIKVNQPL